MLLILFLLFLAGIFYEMYWKRKNLPPGPTPLPLLGNLHQLFWHQPGYTFFGQNKKQFGPIYTWWMGPTTPIVNICDYDLLKETFVKDGDSYTDKFAFNGLNEVFRGGNYGIVDSVGERWREHRRFALHQMRDLGLGKMKMEGRILHEIDELTARFIENPKVDLPSEIQFAIANIINQLVCGYRFEGEKRKDCDTLIRMLQKQQDSGQGPVILVLLFSWMRKMPYFREHWKRLLQFMEEFFEFFEKQIEQHKNEFDYDAEDSTDYVEAYLKEQRRREAEGDFDSFSHIQLKNVCFDIWVAGLNTTTTTLQWGIVYLLNHPDIMEEMHKEMDRVIGSSRLITMTDKNNLPYTHAVVLELQRVLNLVPSNLMHATTKDVVVNGYFLPKGTTVTADIGVLLYDEKLFPEPEKFKPERFLDNGKVKMYPEVMPFSIGKRQCPGEGLARMELFLFIANICNRFNVSEFLCTKIKDCQLSSPSPPSMKKTFANLEKPAASLDLTTEYRFK